MKDILHFGGLKMRFLEVAETFCSRLHGCRWKHIWHFGGLKKRFLAGLVTDFFFVGTLPCREAGVGHVGVDSGANRHATQRPGHVSRHAPLCSLRGYCGFGRIRPLGCGLERHTWLVQGGRCGYYSRICCPCSPVALADVAGSGAAASPGAGRRVACSVESLEPASSFALRFPAAFADERWGAVEAPPRVLRLAVGAAGLFFFLTLASDFLNSLRRAGEAWPQDKAPAWHQGRLLFTSQHSSNTWKTSNWMQNESADYGENSSVSTTQCRITARSTIHCQQPTIQSTLNAMTPPLPPQWIKRAADWPM